MRRKDNKRVHLKKKAQAWKGGRKRGLSRGVGVNEGEKKNASARCTEGPEPHPPNAPVPTLLEGTSKKLGQISLRASTRQPKERGESRILNRKEDDSESNVKRVREH